MEYRTIIYSSSHLHIHSRQCVALKTAQAHVGIFVSSDTFNLFVGFKVSLVGRKTELMKSVVFVNFFNVYFTDQQL